MCYIKCLNEQYIQDSDVVNLCHYILNYLKTCEDQFRGFVRFDDFAGVNYMGVQDRPELCAYGVAQEIIAQNRAYRNFNKTQAYHRVISFDRYDPVNGNDLKYLVERIMRQVYGGYTWAYGIHMDTKHIHVHIVVSAVSRGWKRFSIGHEINLIQDICNDWYDAHCDYAMRKGNEEQVYKNLQYRMTLC